MERGAHRQEHRALGAFGLGNLDSPFDSRPMPRNHDLRRVVVIGSFADFALCRFGCDLADRLKVKAKNGRHRANTNRNGLLHRAPACPQQPRGIGHA